MVRIINTSGIRSAYLSHASSKVDGVVYDIQDAYLYEPIDDEPTAEMPCAQRLDLGTVMEDTDL